jgi:UDP-N-acetylglucosamine/UDP-N-acetylgalactosamine diphosphorylase
LESIPDWAHKLPHHVARKKIPYVDTDKGTTIKPEKPNGIKLEQFVFDVFSMLELNKFGCLEVKREDEFSPLKNAKGTGEDDPDTSKRDIMDQGKRWAEAAGATVVSEGKGDGIEVSPLISYVSFLFSILFDVTDHMTGWRRTGEVEGQNYYCSSCFREGAFLRGHETWL